MKKFSIAKINNNVYKKNNYLETNYKGLAKILYYFNHKILDIGVEKKYNKYLIEIGGGAKPHINYMDTKSIKEYTIIDDIKYKKRILELSKEYKKISFKFINYKKFNLPKKNIQDLLHLIALNILKSLKKIF